MTEQVLTLDDIREQISTRYRSLKFTLSEDGGVIELINPLQLSATRRARLEELQKQDEQEEGEESSRTQ